MSTFAERFAELLAHDQLTTGRAAQRLAVAAGLSLNAIGTIRTRLKQRPDAAIDSETAARLCSAAGVSAHWLLTGEGPMLPSTPARTIELDPLTVELAPFDHGVLLVRARLDRLKGIPLAEVVVEARREQQTLGRGRTAEDWEGRIYEIARRMSEERAGLASAEPGQPMDLDELPKPRAGRKP